MNNKLILTILIFFCCVGFAEAKISPQDLEAHYKKHFRYMTDLSSFNEREYFQSPEDFERRKLGDCDDFAIHSYYILKSEGYKVKMLSLHYDGGGHVVTVFKQRGRWNVMSNGVIHYTRTKGMVKAVKKMYPDWDSIWLFKPVKYGPIGRLAQFRSNLLIQLRVETPKK